MTLADGAAVVVGCGSGVGLAVNVGRGEGVYGLDVGAAGVIVMPPVFVVDSVATVVLSGRSVLTGQQGDPARAFVAQKAANKQGSCQQRGCQRGEQGNRDYPGNPFRFDPQPVTSHSGIT